MEHLTENDPHLRATTNEEKGEAQTQKVENQPKEKEEKILSGISKPITSTADEDKLKEKHLRKFNKFEVVKESLKISLKNWKSDGYNQFQSILNQIFSIAEPRYHAAIVDSITKDRRSDALYTAFKAYIYFIVFKLVFMEIMQIASYYFIQPSLSRYIGIVLENISEKDVEFFDLFKTGDIIDRIKTNESCIREGFLFKTIDLLVRIIKFCFILVYIFSYSRSLTITYAIMFVIKFSVDCVSRRYHKYANFEAFIKKIDLYSSYLNEFVSNIRLVKSFSTEKEEVKKLLELKREIDMPNGPMEGCLWKLTDFLCKLNEILILFVAGSKTVAGEMSFGDIMVFQTYTNNLTGSFDQIKTSFNEYRELFENWKRFLEIYCYQPKIVSKTNLKIKEVKGEVAFKNVTFAYPLKPEVKILKNLSFDIKPGKVVALVGHSGSGKTTVSNLVQRFYDPLGGQIMLDGVDIRDLNLPWLHQQIGFVAQEPTLYSGSIKDNITYGVKEYTQSQFDKVCALANVDKFVNDKSLFPKGYETLVGERGTKVSGGQKQRIAIARALMKDAKILVFDEATSALDAESENDVQSAIDNVIKTRKITTIIIAHRLCTVKNADKILFLSGGRVIEEGTHQELIELNGEYKKLVQRQLVQ